MLSQLLTLVNSTTKSVMTKTNEQDPSAGLYHISSFNDEPYSDRAVVCVQHKRSFIALAANDALASETTLIEDATGTALHGYRVINRSTSVLQAEVRHRWTQTCRLMNSTINYMLTVCDTLGYTNLTRDNIRIVDDISSVTTKRILNSLPVLISPFYINALTARYMIPGWNGHACVLQLAGNYEDPSSTRSYIFGINRTTREARIVEGLNRSGGTWKNG